MISAINLLASACENKRIKMVFVIKTKKAVSKASNTLKNIRSVYVQEQNATVEDDEVTAFRVNLKITFELD